jgi:hypothetical protein
MAARTGCYKKQTSQYGQTNTAKKKENNEPLPTQMELAERDEDKPPYLFMYQDRGIGNNSNEVLVAYVFLFVSDSQEALI